MKGHIVLFKASLALGISCCFMKIKSPLRKLQHELLPTLPSYTNPSFSIYHRTQHWTLCRCFKIPTIVYGQSWVGSIKFSVISQGRYICRYICRSKCFGYSNIAIYLARSSAAITEFLMLWTIASVLNIPLHANKSNERNLLLSNSMAFKIQCKALEYIYTVIIIK